MEKLKKYFFSIFSVTLLSFGMFLAILFNVDPQAADILTITALLASLFLTISGLLSLIIFYLRVKVSNYEILFAQLPIALRHGSLIALAVTGLIFLQMLRVLGWWEGILYLVVLILLESYFKTRPQTQ